MIFQGGKEEGPSIVAGKPDDSPLVKRVVIAPENDPDELLMPPSGKGDPLRALEVRLLSEWIAGLPASS